MADQTAKYLVTGASGQLGALVVAELVGKVPAKNVVALVRRPDAAAALEALLPHPHRGRYLRGL